MREAAKFILRKQHGSIAINRMMTFLRLRKIPNTLMANKMPPRIK